MVTSYPFYLQVWGYHDTNNTWNLDMSPTRLRGFGDKIK